jgi:hypothetical protein
MGDTNAALPSRLWFSEHRNTITTAYTLNSPIRRSSEQHAQSLVAAAAAWTRLQELLTSMRAIILWASAPTS